MDTILYPMMWVIAWIMDIIRRGLTAIGLADGCEPAVDDVHDPRDDPHNGEEDGIQGSVFPSLAVMPLARPVNIRVLLCLMRHAVLA